MKCDDDRMRRAFELAGLAEGDPDELTAGADLDGVEYADLTRDLLEIPGSRVLESRFRGVAADEADLAGARLSEVEFERIHVPVVRAARGQWRDVWISGRLGAVEAYEADWRSVRFEGCKISYLNLRGAELVDVEFDGCIIEELDLVTTMARRVSLTSTKVGRLDVQHSDLGEVDLRGATFDMIEGIAGLRGTIVSPDQLMLLAPLLADELGLTVQP